MTGSPSGSAHLNMFFKAVFHFFVYINETNDV